MAAQAPKHLTYGELDPGNLMFFASNGGNQADDVDHVGIYLGDGWMFHSTGGAYQALRPNSLEQPYMSSMAALANLSFYLAAELRESNVAVEPAHVAPQSVNV